MVDFIVDANQLNTHLENVGARRLRQLVDIVLDEHSFELPENWKPKITIEAAYVNERLDKLLKSPTKLTNFVI